MDQQATVAAAIALSAACAFAASNALQHRAASGVPRGVSKVGLVLLHLARNPWWLVGTFLSFIGMLLHATALRAGSLAFVQPLLLVGLVLAIPVRAALERKLPLPKELRAVAITAVGLATYLSSVTLAPGQATPRRVVAIAMTALGLLLAAAAVAVGRRWLRGRDRMHAGLLGATAGCLFGVSAGMLKLVGADIEHVPFSLLAVLVVALGGVGVLGTGINQRAYQIAPLAFSMPVVNVVGVLVAIVSQPTPTTSTTRTGRNATGLQPAGRRGSRPPPRPARDGTARSLSSAHMTCATPSPACEPPRASLPTF